MAATIKQIAEQAQVSRSAVSAALKDIPGIRLSHETKAKILKIAKDLEYRPAFTSAALKSGRTGLLGFVCGGLHLPFFLALSTALMSESSKFGMQLILMPIDWCAHNDFECLVRMADVVDGLFMTTQILETDNRAMRHIANRRLPFVLLNESSNAVPCVAFDFRHAMRQAFELLTSNGHRKIAFAGDVDDPRKLEAYRSLCKEFSFEPLEYLFDINRDDPQKIIACGERIAENRARHSALISGDFSLSILALGFDRRNLRIPEDLSVVAFAGDTNSVKFFRPPLTSVFLDCEEMARQGMSLMEKCLAEPSGASGFRKVHLKTSVVQRESVKRVGGMK